MLSVTVLLKVSCLSEICGMIPFFYGDVPDQVYRLWTCLFIHAGSVVLRLSSGTAGREGRGLEGKYIP